MQSEEILAKLEAIVGKEYASNKKEELYMYSRDPGASEPRPADFVVLPKDAGEIQEILKLANQERIPVVPLGGGMTLSGLVIPIKGGIVVDLKRMSDIIEVNTSNRYALVEPGVTTGMLMAYLNEHHPDLQVSIPDAPPSVTIAGNVLIHGSGSLSQMYGTHSDMVNGLEVVLPKGEICKLGSCAIHDNWFARGPIPDLIGLFTSAFGTMGIVTKVSVKLFPNYEHRDIVVGMFEKKEKIPEFLLAVTHTQIAEDLIVGAMDKPDWMKGYIFGLVFITGEDEDEIKAKKKALKRLFRNIKVTYMQAPDRLRNAYLEKPQFAARTADFRKGGGFEYVGSMCPMENIPEIFKRGFDISYKYGIIPTMGCRTIGKAHNILFFISYPFNRADPSDIENARNALHDTNKMVMELGGIPWKAEIPAQQMILKKMDPAYKKLMRQIRNVVDPNGIMNPGNWEEME